MKDKLDSTPDFMLQLYAYSGVHEQTLQSVIMELARGKAGFSKMSNDALISRARSRGASIYYKSEVYGPGTALVMIDHDIQWQPGAAEHIAKKAVELNTIVGGLYSKRAEGKGFASRLVGDPGVVKFGVEGTIPAEYVATGFIAIPWTVLDAMVKDIPPNSDLFDWSAHNVLYVSDGPTMEYWTFFETMVTEHSALEGKLEYLSEDWAFCKRAIARGFEPKISTLPLLTHWGDKGFTIKSALKPGNENVDNENSDNKSSNDEGSDGSTH